ncbi:alpha-tocopherol transfer protein-like [Photinus pyralis]|uniref:alpha-tocopherol transfer protein-like n=1 Tax=Photinus pyralis TaxID=7054 RepID=UPI001266E790|nr:alpha-tocopherol transfer protein-like [Photinus pyralis]
MMEMQLFTPDGKMRFTNVEDEYERNKDLHVEDVRSLQGWVEKQQHLPPVSDLQFAIFLHSCHWSMEQAKTTIDKFLTYRGAWPDFFAERNPNDPKVRVNMDVALCSFLPTRTAENYKILYARLMDTNVDKFSLSGFQKVFDMCMMLELMQKGTFDGFVLISDLSNASIGHALKGDILVSRRILLYLQEALPVRLKGIHVITTSAIRNLIVALVKPFLNKEVARLLHFHDSIESLCKFVPRELLPADLGGEGPTTKELHDDMHESFTEYADFFVEQESFVSNESLRDLRPPYMDEDVGIGTGGSFKKLDLD